MVLSLRGEGRKDSKGHTFSPRLQGRSRDSHPTILAFHAPLLRDPEQWLMHILQAYSFLLSLLEINVEGLLVELYLTVGLLYPNPYFLKVKCSLTQCLELQNDHAILPYCYYHV